MRVLRAFLIAVGFATRIPVRVGVVEPRALGESLAALPCVGFGIGFGAYASYTWCAARLGTTLAALAAVAFSASITGGLHLDGVADWFDAMGGGRGSRQRMLEIMRDSRIGAHGAIALLLVLLGKVAAIAELPASLRLPALCAAPAAARLGAVWLLYSLPAARQDGLGRGMGSTLKLHHAATASACYLLVLLWPAAALIWPSLAATACVGIVAWRAKSQLGGVTGDVCGAAIELTELSFLLACRAQFA